jgi:hypothetical protein
MTPGGPTGSPSWPTCTLRWSSIGGSGRPGCGQGHRGAPGVYQHRLQARSVRETGGGRSQRFFHAAVRRFGMTPAQGALPLLEAATDPGAVGGALYRPRWVYWGPPVRRPLFGRSRNRDAMATLWEVSERESRGHVRHQAAVTAGDDIEATASEHPAVRSVSAALRAALRSFMRADVRCPSSTLTCRLVAVSAVSKWTRSAAMGLRVADAPCRLPTRLLPAGRPVVRLIEVGRRVLDWMRPVA